MPGKLLCIDDEQRILDLLIEELSEQGYTVHGATSGHDGFAAILRLTWPLLPMPMTTTRPVQLRINRTA